MNKQKKPRQDIKNYKAKNFYSAHKRKILSSDSLPVQQKKIRSTTNDNTAQKFSLVSCSVIGLKKKYFGLAD